MIKAIKGKVEVTGTELMPTDKNADTVNIFQFVRFMTNDGKSVLIEKVRVRPMVSSWMQVGLSGTFFINETPQGTRDLVAIQVGDQFVDDLDAWSSRVSKNVLKFLVLSPVVLFVAGLLIHGLILSFTDTSANIYGTVPKRDDVTFGQVIMFISVLVGLLFWFLAACTKGYTSPLDREEFNRVRSHETAAT